ncbi:MAG: aldo/keto reductase [Bacteroidota bacterium]
MEYAFLGRTTLQVSRIGLGGLGFGGQYGPVRKIEVLRTVHAALEQGITYFDTSPAYGDGAAESLLAEALGPDTDRVVIATKIGAGTVWELGTWRNNDGPTIRLRLESSLRRLRRDRIDILQIYGPDPHTPPGETMETLLRLRQENKVGFLGTCDADRSHMREALRWGRLEMVQSPYNLLDRSAEREVLPFCRAAGMSFAACEPFFCGLLHGELHRNAVFDLADRREKDRRFRGGAYRAAVESVNRLRAFARHAGISLTELALSWLLQNPLVAVAVCGARSPDHIREISRAQRISLTPDALVALEEMTSPAGAGVAL